MLFRKSDWLSLFLILFFPYGYDEVQRHCFIHVYVKLCALTITRQNRNI